MNGVAPVLFAAFSGFDRAGVRWCLLRGRESLAAPSGDVDLLIHRQDVAAARTVMVETGLVPLRVWSRGTQNFFLGYEASTDTWIDVHAVADLSFGYFSRWRTDVAEAVLERRVRVDGVPMPSDSDRFWVTLFHALLDKGEIRPRHRAALRAVLPSVEPVGVFSELLNRLSPRERWAETAIACVARDDWETLETLAARLARSWDDADPRARWRAMGNRLSLFCAKAREPLQRPGINVALLAPDGAGKTTLCDALVGAFHFPVRRFYLGLEGGKFAKDKPSRMPGLGFSRRLFTLWSSYAAARYHQARRRFVVFDRYPYEALVNLRGTVSLKSRARQYVLGHALPAPDLLVVLDAPARTLHERSREHDETRLERDRQGYLQLAQRMPNSIVIDATRSPAEVRRTAVEEVWRVYRNRTVRR